MENEEKLNEAKHQKLFGEPMIGNVHTKVTLITDTDEITKIKAAPVTAVYLFHLDDSKLQGE